MRPGAPATRSRFTWVLAGLFLAFIDGAVTRSSILWGKTSFEDTRDITRIVFAQTYQAARTIYEGRGRATAPLALLGNSRIWLAARPSYLRPELGRLAPGLDTEVCNLGIFGAQVGDIEMLSRHLRWLAPRLVVLAIDPSDLVATRSTPLANLPARLLRVGWRDGPVPAENPMERLDRWLRTLWPLYRFREFTRAAIEDRFAPATDVRPFPDHFPTTRALFDYMHGAKGAEVEAAYQAWRRQPTLAAFVDYLALGSPGHLAMVRTRARESEPLGSGSPSVRVLAALLDRLAKGQWLSRVVLMPENPLLELDTAGEYQRPGFSGQAVELIREAAERNGIPLVDGRRWMSVEAFIDFDHLMPELSGFQRPLAEEIVRALRS